MNSQKLSDLINQWDPAATGADLHNTIVTLYPICRSITGDGLRQSLRRLQQRVALQMHEIPSGTQVFDWVVPKEWNIRDAYIKNQRGERVVDFQNCSLHVVNYSVPVRQTMSLAELRKHLFTLPEKPEWIPYRTSYYKESWGFCLSHRQWEHMADEQYEVCVDSTLEPGHLTYGELRIQGASDDEVLISCHSCHPSLCNDNLSGMVIGTKLAECLAAISPRYSYRFLWIPATIGAITWLSRNQAIIPKIKHGLVLSCVGDPGRFTYKRSRRGDAEIDRAAEHILRTSGRQFEVVDFSPYGYDERQYCSPGVNLAVGCFMRTPHGQYAQYHTSADNLAFVTPAALADSLYSLLGVIDVLENNYRYVNLNPMCEPQLGRRGLYRLMGGTSGSSFEEALLWVLNLSDGAHSLLDIAERSRLNFRKLHEAAEVLLHHSLLRRLE
jgi:aminopeptidase-like protein